MITTIQECGREAWRRRVVFGSPCERRAQGICRFGPRAVVAYEVVYRRRGFGCVFRTADLGDPECVAIPGVSPGVRMLIGFCRGRRFSRAIALLQELEERGVLQSLPDSAFLRAAVALGTSVSTSILADSIANISAREARPWIY